MDPALLERIGWVGEVVRLVRADVCCDGGLRD